MSSQKIKVCHLTSVHPRNDVRIFHKQCKGLSKYYEISLIVADNLGDSIEDDIKIEVLKEFLGNNQEKRESKNNLSYLLNINGLLINI